MKRHYLILGVIMMTAAISVGFSLLQKTRLVLIGDSTVRNGSNPTPESYEWGWGTSLETSYQNENLEVLNHAMGGTSSRTFYRDLFPAVLEELQAGDVLVIQFGHNDGGAVTGEGKASLSGIGDNIQNVTNSQGQVETVHSYGWYLRQMVQQAKAKGATPVIASLVPRNRWDEDGIFVSRSLETHGLWARQVADAEGVAFLDLNNLVADLYDQLGRVEVTETLFATDDELHTVKAGADATAEIVYNGLIELNVISIDDSAPENIWEIMGNDNQISDVATAYGSAVGRVEGGVEVPYAVFTSSADGLVVKKRNASGQWEQVGTALTDYKFTNSGNRQAIAQSYLWLGKDNVLYCSYVDGSDGHRLKIVYYKEAAESWEPLGDNAANLQVSTGGISPWGTNNIRDQVNHYVAFDKNNVLYIAYGETPTNTRKGAAHVKRFVGGAWELVGGGAIPIEGAPSYGAAGYSVAFDSQNRPFVSYAWSANNPDEVGAVQVRYFDAGSWKTLGDVTSSGQGSSARYTQMGISNDMVFVYFMNTGSGSRPFLVYSPIADPSWTNLRIADHANSVNEQLVVDAAGNMTISHMESWGNIYVYHLTKSKIAEITPSSPLTLASFITLEKSAETALVDAGARLSMSVSASGDPYILYTKNERPFVQRYLFPKIDFIPNTWEIMGSDNQISDVASAYGSAVGRVEGGVEVPYAVFTSSADGLVVKKRNASGQWEQVGAALTDYKFTNSGNRQAIAQSYLWLGKDNVLYCSYVDGSDGHRLKIVYYKEAAESWEPLGDNAANLQVSTGGISPWGTNNIRDQVNHYVAFDKNNVLYIAYGETPTNTRKGAAHVKRFVGGAWELVGGGAIPIEGAPSYGAAGYSVAFDSQNRPFVSYAWSANNPDEVGAVQVRYFDAGSWKTLGDVTSSGQGSSARYTQMGISNDMVFVYFMNTGSGSRPFLVYSPIADPSWTNLRMADHANSVNEQLVVDAAGNMTISHMESWGNIYVYHLTKSKIAAISPTIPLTAASFLKLEQSAETPVVDAGARLSMSVSASGKPYIIYTKNERPFVQRYHLVVDETEEPEPEPEPDEVVTTPRWLETLDRGLVAVRPAANRVFLSWRLLGNETMDLGFNLYRDNLKLNAEPIVGSTNYQDVTEENGKYTVVPVVNDEEGEPSKTVEVWSKGYLSIPMDMPPTGVTPDGQFYTHTANDLSVGDLDGDGEYEIVVKWEPTLTGDMGGGQRGLVYLDAYKMDGTKLWRINLGKNIRAGAHYTQFLVFDFDGDGKSELAVRTSDGTVDGTGAIIGDADADHRTNAGYILSGPEFVTVFNGLTGKAMASVDYIPERGRVADWGDGYGNRVDRFTAAVAYLDGERPSMVFGRGYYTRMVRAAFDWRDGKLTHRWTFDSNVRGNESFAGQGNHQMSVADVDNDGKDEIINGASVINDNGKKLYTTTRGHGDALHVSQMDPSKDKQLIWMPHESPSSYKDLGVTLVDGTTGETIFGIPTTGDIGRAMAADIDPRYPGFELWSSRGVLYNVNGTQVSAARPGSMNFGIWWDGDLLRELLDGVNIYKWDWLTNTQKNLVNFAPYNAASNNSSKATPNLSADILGDWREEVIFRTADSKELMIFTTAIPTEHKLYTLMHDSQYRTAIAWQNSAYNQPPYPSFYLGEGMVTQEEPNIALVALEKEDQEIDFQNLDPVTFDAAHISPGAEATSGLRISYTTDNDQVVQVENQQLKLVGVGTVNITAKQGGNISWNAADPVTKTLVVNKGQQVIEFEDLPTLTVRDQPYQPTVSSTSGLPVTLESEDLFYAIVSNNQITVNEGGRVGIVAYQPGDQLWEPAVSVRKELEILALPTMDVAKAITPNGDGANDILLIKEIERYPENKVSIFNRQGQLLFSITDYNNSDRAFEGRTSSGQLLEDGTYFFKLEWIQDGKSLDQSGWFYLKK
ncbi:T9SS type B sorting domain-containing protein [Sphingobacterium olei]|uniref:T9SS type B sorting domain-containing protein n=1 Tax=Sphingobacterium olei TaxID=2571155 RepID=A0A4U0P394_9SPHI|nr:gliding motility-associated C-terminal domain-containing protein [Sphingobacterium olei]TJZ61797.1 T9SS type B sorting domain-containing protein [Sphingobacterium olei]